jgi:hypothetical protein
VSRLDSALALKRLAGPRETADERLVPQGFLVGVEIDHVRRRQ